VDLISPTHLPAGVMTAPEAQRNERSDAAAVSQSRAAAAFLLSALPAAMIDACRSYPDHQPAHLVLDRDDSSVRTDIIATQSPHDHETGPEDPDQSYRPEHGKPTSEQEYDFLSCTPLVPLPLQPIQLETRGVTSHVSAPAKPPVRFDSQSEFWARQTVYKQTIAAKLREGGRPDLASTLEQCHTIYTIAECTQCRSIKKFPNRCDQFFCPECTPRLTHERVKSIEWWSLRIPQPKHVVLTITNTPTLNSEMLHEAKAFLSKLRRRKFTENWRSGCWSMEITNEGRGWHVHFHLLVDAVWIDAGKLAREWNAATGGLGHIVKVKDARSSEYLSEIVKYISKPSQTATWSQADIVTFVESVQGQRTFGVFGDLYGQRTEFAEWIASIRDEKPLCECGCSQIRYYTEGDWEFVCIRRGTAGPARPPPRPLPDPEFPFNDHRLPVL